MTRSVYLADKGDDFTAMDADYPTYGIHIDGRENKVEVHDDPNLRDTIVRLLRTDAALEVYISLTADRLEYWTIQQTSSDTDEPWYVIDSRTAEPEVNWLGELIAGPFGTRNEARKGMARALVLAARGLPFCQPRTNGEPL